MVDNPNVPHGQGRFIKEDGITYLPAAAILRGRNDEYNAYWNSFLPIFFDRMSLISRRVMAECVRKEGLTGIHAMYLVALDLRDGLTLKDLSSFLDMDAANTNRVVKVLREKGFIYDDRKESNSKKFAIHLTEGGKAVADSIIVATNSVMNSFFNGIPQANLDNMRATLIKILYNADPGFESYVDSHWTNPFFTYLGLGWDEEDPTALRFKSKVFGAKK